MASRRSFTPPILPRRSRARRAQRRPELAVVPDEHACCLAAGGVEGQPSARSRLAPSAREEGAGGIAPHERGQRRIRRESARRLDPLLATLVDDDVAPPWAVRGRSEEASCRE